MMVERNEQERKQTNKKKLWKRKEISRKKGTKNEIKEKGRA
jgi:hypothetical protein